MFSNALKSRVARLITISKNIKLLHTLRLLYYVHFRIAYIQARHVPC